MNLYERVLTVLACKVNTVTIYDNINDDNNLLQTCQYVDEVVIGAPEKLTKEFLKGLNVQVVVHGKDPTPLCEDGSDPYEAAKELGIYVEIDSESTLTTSVIVERIVKARQQYEERNQRKEAKELAIIAEHEAKST